MEKDALNFESPSELEDTSLKLLDRLGYLVESFLVSGKSVCVKAKSLHEGVEESTLVCVYARKAMVGERLLVEVWERVRNENFKRALVLSASDFTGAAIRYAQDKPIDLVDSDHFKRLLIKHGIAEGEIEAEKIKFVYESAFKAGLPEDKAREFFKSRKKKKFLLIGSPGESLSTVELRFAPLARINAPISGKMKEFYINLNTGALVYTRRDILKKKTVLEEAAFIRVINDLGEDPVRLLGEIVRAEQARFSETGVSSGLSDREKTGVLVELKALKLIGITNEHNPLITSNMNLPRLSDSRFNLEEQYKTEERLESVHESDPIKYAVDDVGKKTSLFFDGNTKLEKVLYMPYYRCSFVDARSRVRFGVLPALEEKTST